MKYQFIEAHRHEYPVTMMCRVLAVARTGYYQWRKQPLSARKVADGILFLETLAAPAFIGRYGRRTGGVAGNGWPA